jgi:DNA-binding PadR family transcriptional regulator
MDTFTVKDIEKIYDEARLVPPKNFSDLINKARKKGYLIETKEKTDDGLKVWKISAEGIEYIESLPEG